MKKITIIAVIVLLLYACTQAEKKSPVKSEDEPTGYPAVSYALCEQNIRGNIAEVIDSQFVYNKEGKMIRDSIHIYHTYYENNMAVRGIEIDSPAIKFTYTQTYTPERRYMSMEYKKGDTMVEYLAYKFDSLTDLGFAKNLKYGKVQYYYTDLLYNEYQKIQFARVLKPDSTFDFSRLMTYDKWRLTSAVNWDSAGRHYSTSYHQLNEFGDAIRDSIVVYRKSGPRPYVTRYRYPSRDENNNWTERIQTDSSGKPTHRVARQIKYLD